MARLHEAAKSFGARACFLHECHNLADKLFYQPLCTVHLKKVGESEEIKLAE